MVSIAREALGDMYNKKVNEKSVSIIIIYNYVCEGYNNYYYCTNNQQQPVPSSLMH